MGSEVSAIKPKLSHIRVALEPVVDFGDQSHSRCDPSRVVHIFSKGPWPQISINVPDRLSTWRADCCQERWTRFSQALCRQPATGNQLVAARNPPFHTFQDQNENVIAQVETQTKNTLFD